MSTGVIHWKVLWRPKSGTFTESLQRTLSGSFIFQSIIILTILLEFCFPAIQSEPDWRKWLMLKHRHRNSTKYSDWNTLYYTQKCRVWILQIKSSSPFKSIPRERCKASGETRDWDSCLSCSDSRHLTRLYHYTKGEKLCRSSVRG